MFQQLASRQRIRKGLIITSFLLFPIIMNYFSPSIIIDGAAQGIINGSLVVFSLQFVSAFFLGRLWCGWVCPAAGLGEISFSINNKPVRKKINWIKWLIWIPWLSIIVWTVIRAGGYHQFNFFHLTESGISIDEPVKYFLYYIVVMLFFVLAVIIGRRAGCHTICWMAPFMIIGRKIRNLCNWPALRLKANTQACINCKRCTRDCPMSLDVNAMVQAGQMENSECVLCGTCADVCPKDVIRYSFSKGK